MLHRIVPLSAFLAALSATFLAVPLAAQAQAPDALYIVRFKEAAVPQVRAGSVRDDRVAQDPEAWGYVGERVLGHVQALEQRYGVRAEAAYGHALQGMSVRLNATQLERLRRDDSVDWIEADQDYGLVAKSPSTTVSNSVPQSVPWGITQTQATQSFTLAGNGSGSVSGVRAYVIDTGIDMANADLNRAGLVNFVGDRKNTDCNGHGTHVAGTIAASDNSIDVVGMAPGVSVYGVKVLDCTGSGTTTSVIKGIDWVTANAVLPAVANMSLGGGASQTLDDAVRKAAAKGIVFSLAAGNAAVDACTTSPARVGGGGTAGVMTVAATDSSDQEASFSNYGNCVDLWAPGVNISSLKIGGGVAVMSGTSMASPHAGGAAALYWARYPSSTAASVVTTLKGLAVSTGTFSKDGRAIRRLSANVQ